MGYNMEAIKIVSLYERVVVNSQREGLEHIQTEE